MLYLVATPIGNREDITIRALKILRSVDIVFAEDTRKARTLLSSYRIHKPLESYFEHNEPAQNRKIIALLRAGKNVALIAEAGTPGISDPGYRLIQECVKQKLSFEVIPGVSAVITALAASGLPTDKFLFLGFPPRKRGKRLAALREAQTLNATLVFFESPQRLTGFLEELNEVLPGRRVVIARELTKMFEEVRRFANAEEAIRTLNNKPCKGEHTVLVEGSTRRTRTPGEAKDN